MCADGPRHSKPSGSPGFGGLDSSPVIQQRKKRPFRASEDAPAASLLGSPHQAGAAQGQPAPAQELPTPAWEPLAQVALRSPEPPRALPEPVTTFDDQEAAEFLGLESLSEAEVRLSSQFIHNCMKIPPLAQGTLWNVLCADSPNLPSPNLPSMWSA